MKEKALSKVDQAFTTWKKESSPQRMQDLLGAMSGDLDSAIRRSGNEVNPLTQGIAKQIAIHAARTYKTREGALFSSWANTQLQRLSRRLRQTRFVMRVPEAAAREAFRVKSMIAEMEAEEGVLPTEAALADRLKISPRRIKAFMASTTPEVLTEEVPGQPEEELSRLVQDMVYHSVPATDQYIMEHIFGYGGKPVSPAVEVARRLKISPAAISQRATRLRERLAIAEEASV